MPRNQVQAGRGQSAGTRQSLRVPPTHALPPGRRISRVSDGGGDQLLTGECGLEPQRNAQGKFIASAARRAIGAVDHAIPVFDSLVRSKYSGIPGLVAIQQ